MAATGTAIGRALAAALLLLPVVAAAQDSGDWRMRGQTTSRVEYYDIDGDSLLGPYGRDGVQAYQSLHLGLSRQADSGALWDLEFAGVLSASEYRTTEPGGHVEYLRLRREDPAAAVPYRLDVGDQHARFSRLSLDQDLRGVRGEIQPALGGLDHSLVWVSGAYRRHWHDVDARLDPGLLEPEADYHGVSWLVADPALGEWSLNTVHHDRTAGADGGDRHLVTSLAAALDIRFLHQRLDTDLEWAHLQGTTRRGSGGAGERAVADTGLFAQVDGSNTALEMPLDYRLRYEDYGAGFRPAGTDVVGDRRAFVTTAGVGSEERARLQGRYQRHVDHASGPNPVHLVEHGVEAVVPFGLGPVHTRHELDAAHRERRDERGWIDEHTRRLSWDMILPLAETRETRLTLYWRNLDDRATGRYGHRERRISLSHRTRFRLGGVQITATPGLAYRTRDGFLAQRAIDPTLSLEAAGALQELDVSLGYHELERPGRRARSIDEYRLAMDWHYRLRRHQLGLEYEHHLAAPSAGEDLELWKAGVFWRYQFAGSL
ncbi:hypothetical protein QWY84_04100 [Aquisalimonas lutea]|uniref:hypothetical protein n=1 Tax=Aquisalimonas lutea TaxID=1327750 RepID=UPI0025B483D5|nr:hypothetical protein [Aquisalimonas lutea]MDN3516788.1 hypothetical protein [Aquisalimonas lutea]